MDIIWVDNSMPTLKYLFLSLPENFQLHEVLHEVLPDVPSSVLLEVHLEVHCEVLTSSEYS